MAKKRRKMRKKSSKILIYFLWILLILVLVGSILSIGYYLGYSDAKSEITKLQNEKVHQKEFKELQNKKLHKKEVIPLPKHTKAKIIEKTEDIKHKLKEVLKKEQDIDVTAGHEYADEHLALPPKPAKRKIVKLTSKPKLAIIIDDMSTKSQVREVEELGLNLTMSFLPPRPGRAESAKLAAKEKFYMVHLPMEAMHYTAEEPNTLRITDSQEKISKRIRYIKKIFPRVKYINNHTGSKFTSNEKAMNRLIYALKKNHINFIDSRTIAQTKAPQVMKNYGLRYISRDVFLDHHTDEAYVLGQIKEAIKIAKLHGYAIAIGHPHLNTLKALKASKSLFKSVDLVQVDKIY